MLIGGVTHSSASQFYSRFVPFPRPNAHLRRGRSPSWYCAADAPAACQPWAGSLPTLRLGSPPFADYVLGEIVNRRSTAFHLVFAGVDINTVRAWLGHASIDTSNIYAEINIKMKAEAVALCGVASKPDSGCPWKEDKGLIAFLDAY